MRKRKSHKDPLLYIHQSNNKTPEAYMQQGYTTPKRYSETGIEGSYHTSESNNNKKSRSIRKSSYFKSPYMNEENKEEYVTSKTNDAETEHEPDGLTQRPRDKKFKEMNIEEKIYYFSHAPDLAPKLRCEVKTYDRSFRGKIVDFANNEVYMRIGRRKSSEKIPFDEIRDIRLLGF